MLKRLPKCLLLFLIVCCVKSTVLAQMVDNSLRAKQTTVYADVERDFYKKIGPQSRLYNGMQHDQYDPHIKGNAYFNDIDSLTKGSVFYDGYLYTNENMMYDIYKDEVVIVIYNNFMRISLISEKVRDFDLLNQHFIYLKNDPANSNSLKSGFYDELYGGKIQVLSKKTKSIQNSTDYTGNITPYFLPAKDYYLLKNGKYYTVNSQGAFLDALSDHKKEVKQFIRSNSIKFKKAPEQAMTAIAAYYDHLTD
ncbi:MAG: hypothetical protein ACHQF4_05075 [Sphingobacteriales bacterium]